MVICGDFNYPKISWDASDTSMGASEQAFVEALHDHYLTQIQCKPTRGTSVLDLVITSVPDQTSVSEVLEIDKPGLFTDHRTVFFEFRTLVKAPVKTHRSVYDYPKGDFDGLRNALRSVNLTSVVGEGDLESCWQIWKNLFPCCGERQYCNQAIKRWKPRALALRCRNQSYQEKGNRTQETKIAPVRVTKSQISNSAFTTKARDQRKQERVF